MNAEDFAKELKAAREKAELSKMETASLLHLHVGTIDVWERGKRAPKEFVQKAVLRELRAKAKKGE